MEGSEYAIAKEEHRQKRGERTSTEEKEAKEHRKQESNIQKTLSSSATRLLQGLLLHLGRGLEILLCHPRRDVVRYTGDVDVSAQRHDREDDYAKQDIDCCGIHCEVVKSEVGLWGFESGVRAEVKMRRAVGCWGLGALVGGGDAWWNGMLWVRERERHGGDSESMGSKAGACCNSS